MSRAILYRIAQEALTNVVKHARASRVDVVLEESSDGVMVRISDDGVGLSSNGDSSGSGHIGLVAMRERAEMAGGWWRISSTAGKGTSVEFLVPGLLGSAAEEAA